MKPPSDETLVRYLLGTAAEDEAAQVERYLAADPAGFERLERIRVDDDLVAKVRSVMSADQETLASAGGPAVTLSSGPHGSHDPMGSDAMDVDADAATRRTLRVGGASDRSGTAVPVSSKPPKVHVEGYEILEELGRGGMGLVFAAIQQSTKRKVALKVLLEGPFASKAARQRFEREVELAARLNHPNVVTILESGVASGRYYFAMQYIEGLTLDKYFLTQRPSVSERLRVFVRICRAVSYAHQCGIIHRDLKPSNILVDAKGEPHVLDFGLAKPADTYTDDLEQSKALSLTGQLMGTLPYMSPEQAAGRNQQIDIRTDIYSLGIMLYEALTGQFPYEVVGQLLDVLRNIQENVPQRPSTSQRRINNELETILFKALAKEPERRYQSAEGLASDLEAFLSGAPIDAKRDSSLYVARKLLYRHRRAISLVLILLTVLTIGGAIVRRQKARLAEAGAQRLLADFVSDASKASLAYAASSSRVQERVEATAARYVTASAAPQRVIGAASGLHVAPGAFWKSIEEGPLFESGEWLEICAQEAAMTMNLRAAIRNMAVSGSPRQRYVAWCLWGALANPTHRASFRDACRQTIATEEHAGIQAACRWAVRATTDASFASAPEITFCDELSSLRFVQIPPCTGFQRGSPATDRDRFDDESGADPVDIAAFYMADTEVTWAAWKMFLEDPASHSAVTAQERAGLATLVASLPADDHPHAAAGFITRPAARAYCAWLTARAAETDQPRQYRLPTEDEWEYACRGGSDRRFCYGDDAGYAGYFANCNGTAPTWHVVARHMPNWYGLYDMHGGLWEWTSSVQEDAGRLLAVYRGGAFYSPALRCRSAQRNYGAPEVADSYRGLRLVMEFID